MTRLYNFFKCFPPKKKLALKILLRAIDLLKTECLFLFALRFLGSRATTGGLEAQHLGAARGQVELEPAQVGIGIQAVILGQVLHALVDVAVATIAGTIAVKHTLVLALGRQHGIVTCDTVGLKLNTNTRLPRM